MHLLGINHSFIALFVLSQTAYAHMGMSNFYVDGVDQVS
jgi:hypothetical protein